MQKQNNEANEVNRNVTSRAKQCWNLFDKSVKSQTTFTGISMKI